MWDLTGLFNDIGQVKFVIGQVKVEDHLPDGRQYYKPKYCIRP